MFMRLKFFRPAVRVSRSAATLLTAAALAATSASAATLDTIGVTLLRATTTNLNGAGVRVAQPEASLSTNAPVFEVRPSSVGQPVSLFTYYSTNGTSTNFPNAVGSESGHANAVAAQFFGLASGVATNVAHVDNYDADYFINTYVDTPFPPDPGARIVNQSFTYGTLAITQQQQVDSAFDDAAALHNTLFVSGADNSGVVKAPATSYNGIGVAAYGGSSAIGPTPDNGRSKPDITAPADVTSYSTPLVAGAAAVLLQAGLRGDGGGDTNSAADMRTLKALLLNGALKPANWTNGPSTPLDARYGAGVLNVFNSYMQLAGGKHAAVEQTSVNLLDPHPPGANPTNINAWSGWSFDSLSSTPPNKDRLNHHYFSLTNAVSNATFTVTATLAWNRQQNQTAINDLDLFLYDIATSNLVAESISGVDNVEHLFVTSLAPGRYDLQVLKYGGNAGNGNVTSSETYALAWEFFALPLAIAQADTNAVLAWPIYPEGFALQATPGLNPATWATLNLPRVVTNGTNRVEVPLNSSNQFFRLLRTN
jgi:hypothetical protein